jgi:hypothetical protein
MALDHAKYNQEIDFYQKIYENNPDFIGGITGYEDYYIDILSFWRYLYFRDGLGGAEYAPSQALDKDGKPKLDYYYTSSK